MGEGSAALPRAAAPARKLTLCVNDITGQVVHPSMHRRHRYFQAVQQHGNTSGGFVIVNKRLICMAVLFALTGGGCAKGESPPFDQKNPFHCGVALTLSRGLAISQGKHDRFLRELHARIRWAGEKSRALSPSQRTREEGLALLNWLYAHPTVAADRSISCLAEQDRDPDFIAFRKANISEFR